MRPPILAVSVCLAVISGLVAPEKVAVAVVAAPDGGIQPQAVVDSAGIVHLVYFKGEPSGGDLYYAELTNGSRITSGPVRVNSIPGSALATGSVRGAQIALGRNGRVHVAWHGAKPLSAAAGSEVPVWYTRSAAAGRFEDQRAVSGDTQGLDGGSVAADASGHVAVAWHAMGSRPGEEHRTVYLARSSDDGATFAREATATAAQVGACGCCGLRAMFDRAGALHVLYRAATDGTHRDTTWLTIDDRRPVTPIAVHPWELSACPMTTYALTETTDGLAAAWETAQQIYSARLSTATRTVSTPTAIPGSGVRKHPSIAVNARGDQLIAWTEGTAWKRGGTLAWRTTDRSGREIAASDNAGPVPVWGLVSAVAMKDGSFVIFR